MMRKFFGTIAVLAFVAVSAQSAAAQGFKEGYLDIGPAIGLGGIGNAGISFGARAEKGIKPLESLGGGILGIQLGVDYYSWSDSYSGFGDVSWSNISFAATANYHFKMSDTKFDPFVGLGLGFESWSCSYDFSGFDYCGAYSTGVYFVGRVGARYFFGEKMAAYADLGAGAATINFGLMFKLK